MTDRSMADDDSRTQSVATGERENYMLLRSPSTSSKTKNVKGINFQVAENGSNLSAGEK